MGTEPRSPCLRRWRAFLGAPVDARGIAAFRIAFGALMAFSSVRFVARGWVESLILEPRFHFAYSGFAWLGPGPAPVVYACFALMALGALGVMLGLFYRAAALALFLTFTAGELFDRSYYLNHYYLVSLLAALGCVLPLHRVWSLDAWRLRRRAISPAQTQAVARAVPILLRVQLGLVYFYAGVAKLDADWLLRGEPLTTWLRAHDALTFAGGALQTQSAALTLGWMGAAFDLGVPLALSLRRTRAYAYAAVVVFHLATGFLFPIGVFPWLMIALTPVFFAHDWPSASIGRARAPAAMCPAAPSPPLPWLPATGLVAYLLVQTLLPLRHWLYTGPVNWTREGFDFAWRVMLTETTGSVRLRVVDRRSGERFVVAPEDELTALQTARMAAEPAMIAQYAEHVASRFRVLGHEEVAVYADAWASLNGRPAQRLLDPCFDLASPRPALAPDRAVLPLADPAPVVSPQAGSQGQAREPGARRRRSCS